MYDLIQTIIAILSLILSVYATFQVQQIKKSTKIGSIKKTNQNIKNGSGNTQNA